MLLNASSRIAVKCSGCGKFSVVDLNIFKMTMPTSHRCDCGNRMFRTHVCKSLLILDIDCIACETIHSYKFSLKDVMQQRMNLISCPVTGIEIAFLGKYDFVNDIVERYIEDMKIVFKSFGVLENKASRVVK